MKRKQKAQTTRLKLPVSDTVPAPGTYTVEVLNMEGDGLPVVDRTDLIETTGAGTAKDIASALQAPESGRD